MTFSSFGSLLDSVCSAIFREEGRPAGFANPGDLRAAPWLSDPVIVAGFWLPGSREEGLSGAYHVVALHIAEGNTLRQLISDWAPPSQNNTDQYLQNVQQWTGIEDPDIPLWGTVQEPA